MPLPLAYVPYLFPTVTVGAVGRRVEDGVRLYGRECANGYNCIRAAFDLCSFAGE